MPRERRSFLFCITVCLWAFAAPGSAQDLAGQQKALQLITEAARSLCESAPQKGSSNSLELSGAAKAKLNGTVSKLADLGIEGAAKYQSREYEGVLQNEVAGLIQQTTNCRLEVFRTLQAKLITPSVRPIPQPNPQSPSVRQPNPQQGQTACPPGRLRDGICIPICSSGMAFSLDSRTCMPAQYVGGVIPCSQDDTTFDRATARLVPRCR